MAGTESTPPSIPLSEHLNGAVGTFLSNTFSTRGIPQDGGEERPTLNEGFLGSATPLLVFKFFEEGQQNRDKFPIPRSEYSLGIMPAGYGTYSASPVPSFIFAGYVGYKGVFSNQFSLSLAVAAGGIWKSTPIVEKGKDKKINIKVDNPDHDKWVTDKAAFDEYDRKLTEAKNDWDNLVKSGVVSGPFNPENYRDFLGPEVSDPGKEPPLTKNETHIVKGDPAPGKEHELDEGVYLLGVMSAAYTFNDWLGTNFLAQVNAQLYGDDPGGIGKITENGNWAELSVLSLVSIQPPLEMLNGKLALTVGPGYAATFGPGGWSHHFIFRPKISF